MKLENTLLQVVKGLPLPILKICDFGYSKADGFSAAKSKVCVQSAVSSQRCPVSSPQCSVQSAVSHQQCAVSGVASAVCSVQSAEWFF